MKISDAHPLYPNRELSWLKFNERVLKESLNPHHPLLERVRFLAISASNLDEFFMVRVGGLMEQHFQNISTKDLSGRTVEEQLFAISHQTKRMMSRQAHCWRKIAPELNKENIQIITDYEVLTISQQSWLRDYFKKQVLPTLTPLGVDTHHSFPLLLCKSLNLAVRLTKTSGKKKPKITSHTAIIQVPALVPRLIQLHSSSGKTQFFLLENLIKLYCDSLFRGYQIQEITVFRLTRNADFTVDDEEAEDLLAEVKKSLFERTRGQTVRLEIESTASKKLLSFLTSVLNIHEKQVQKLNVPIDLTVLNQVADLTSFPELRFPDLELNQETAFNSATSLFDQIKEHDILLHHPYESFDPIISFIEEAANDPNVLAIKQTIYRIGQDPRLINALIRAARKGKQVTVLTEVKARFDEANNILRGKQLEEAGCHVIYGIPGLKTHGKIILIVRQEENDINRYLHLSTGNYNPSTAKVYTDVALFTCNPLFGEDATEFFNILSGYSEPPKWHCFSVAPFNLRQKFSLMIRREIQNAKAGKPARIVAKMNSLFDQSITDQLYKASQAGVQIDLVVRGICSLKPAVPGLSENIRVYSIIGRFLEHHRIFYFQNDTEPELYLSSADWMHRNLDNRVELLFPVLFPPLKSKLSIILGASLADTTGSSTLLKSGNYRKRKVSQALQFNSQKAFSENDPRLSQYDISKD